MHHGVYKISTIFLGLDFFFGMLRRVFRLDEPSIHLFRIPPLGEGAGFSRNCRQEICCIISNDKNQF
jgi:hypothetical protein